MSNAPCLQPNLGAELISDCQFDHILSQMEQQYSIRGQVATALRVANAAFAAQCTDPNGYAFMTRCEDLARFLKLKIPLEYSEQLLLMQALQVACGMHEKVINDPVLTPAQRSSHQLATTSLLPLCRTALEFNITYPDIWFDVCKVIDRARQAHDKATEALDLSKYLDLDHSEENPLPVSENDSCQSSPSLSTLPSSPGPPGPPPASKPAKRRRSAHATAASARPTSRSAKRKEQILATPRDKPYKALPLGRSLTAPDMMQSTPNFCFSPTFADRTSSFAYSRGQALYALQETEVS